MKNYLIVINDDKIIKEKYILAKEIKLVRKNIKNKKVLEYLNLNKK